MMGFNTGQRNLLFGLASTFVLAAMGAAVFHVRWHDGAGPTELMGWWILVAIAIASLTQLSLNAYTPISRRQRVHVFIGVAAGSAIMALTPFSIVEHLVKAYPAMGTYTMFNLLFSMVVCGAFILASAIYTVVERGLVSETV